MAAGVKGESTYIHSFLTDKEKNKRARPSRLPVNNPVGKYGREVENNEKMKYVTEQMIVGGSGGRGMVGEETSSVRIFG